MAAGSARPRLLVLLALSLVVLRLAVFDYAAFFRLHSIPNHDMSQGASLFATSMHAMRTEGDVAWWNPATSGGYAQYYLALLSPLAPTLGHIVFIVWAQIVFLLGLTGGAVPEYFQYLTLTYVVLPFLAILTFAWTCRLLFRSAAAVALGAIVFTFSTIGLWHSAWFYFQEPATLWFLLGAAIAFLRRPEPRRALLLLAAGLVQLASFNYWTLFNSWFVAIFLGTYAAVHRVQVRRAARRLAAMIRRWPAAAAASIAGALVVVALWVAVLASTVHDQGAAFQRKHSEGVASFTLQDALVYISPYWYLPRAFHPDIEKLAPQPYDTFWTIHHAVYLGAFLAPLLLALTFQRWRRVDRWLLLVAAAVFAVCVASPPARWAWEHIPWMDRIRHLFRFYPMFFMVTLLLLCCGSLDRLLTGPPVTARRRALGSLALGVVAIVLLGGWSLDPLPRLGNLPAGLLLLIPALVLALFLARPTPGHRALFAGVVLLVALVDLPAYFRHVCRLDNDFTVTRWNTPRPLPPDVARMLRRPWAPIDPDDPGTLFRNMPLATDLWPVNAYLPHRYVLELPEGERDDPWDRQFAGFHAGADRAWMARAPGTVLSPLAVEWRARAYNRWTAVVEAPEPGWLSCAQIHDPAWRATVDGEPVPIERANAVRTALPIDSGRHEVALVYRPWSRRLYWPAAVALEIVLLVLAGLGIRAPPRWSRLTRPQARRIWPP